MNVQEFVLVPLQFYHDHLQQNRDWKTQILENPKIQEKSKLVSAFSRAHDPIIAPSLSHKDVKDKILNQLAVSMPSAQIEKSRFILDEIEQNNRIEITEGGMIAVDTEETTIHATDFLHALQQSTKKLPSTYDSILKILPLPAHVVNNTYAKAYDARWTTFKR